MPTVARWTVWLVVWFALAATTLLLSAQGDGTTGPIDLDLERSRLSDSTRSAAGQSDASPQLMSMAQATLDSVGIVSPPIWQAAALTVTSVTPGCVDWSERAGPILQRPFCRDGLPIRLPPAMIICWFRPTPEEM